MNSLRDDLLSTGKGCKRKKFEELKNSKSTKTNQPPDNNNQSSQSKNNQPKPESF